MKRNDLIFDAVILDLDGVIVDSSDAVERVWSRWAEENKIPWVDVRNYIHGKRTVEIIRRFAPDLDEVAETEIIEDRQSRDTNNITINKEIIEFLESIRGCLWAVVTSSTRPAALSKLSNVNFDVRGVLVTGDDVKSGKPSSEGYLMAAHRLDVAPENCMVIEDSPVGIEAGRNADMYVIAVKTMHGEADLKNAHMIVDNVSEINSLCADGLKGRRITLLLSDIAGSRL